MGFYARPSWRLTGQLLSDVFVLAWAVGWWWVSRLVDEFIRQVASPVRSIADTARELTQNLDSAADAAGKVPLAGDGLRAPLDDAAGGVASISSSALEQVDAINLTATAVGWAVFVIPVLIVAAFWLPGRWRYHQHMGAAQKFIDQAADLDLFALRAMASQPMRKLAAISDDPIAAWRSGDRETINALASLELRSCGLRPPRNVD